MSLFRAFERLSMFGNDSDISAPPPPYSDMVFDSDSDITARPRLKRLPEAEVTSQRKEAIREKKKVNEAQAPLPMGQSEAARANEAQAQLLMGQAEAARANETQESLATGSSMVAETIFSDDDETPDDLTPRYLFNIQPAEEGIRPVGPLPAPAVPPPVDPLPAPAVPQPVDPIPAPAMPQPMDPIPAPAVPQPVDPLHKEDSSDNEWPFPVEAQGSPEWAWFDENIKIRRQEEAMALEKSMAEGRSHDSV